MSNTPGHTPDPGRKKPDPAERLALLADAYLHGELSPEGLTELEALIKSDPANAKRFIAVTEQAGMMREVFTNVTDQLELVEDKETDDFLSILSELDAPEDAPLAPVDFTAELARREMEDKERERGRRRLAKMRHASLERHRPIVVSKPLAWLGIAAVLGLVAAAVWMSQPTAPREVTQNPDAQVQRPAPPRHEQPTQGQPTPGTPQVAVVSDAIGARLADGSAVSPGMRIFAQPLDLAQGVIELTLTSGVTLTLEGPTRLEPASDMYVALDHGKLVGRVSDRGHGFTVHANHADIVDLGTEFAIEVTAEQTRIQVYEGEVRVDPTSAGLASRHLLGGAAGVVSHGGYERDDFSASAYLRGVPTSYGWAVRAHDPLVWWSFDDAPGGRPLDAGRASAELLPQGEVVRRVDGLQGRAAVFDGSRGSLSVSQPDGVAVSTDFSLEVWVRVEGGTDASSRIISNRNANNTGGFALGLVGAEVSRDTDCLAADGGQFRPDPLGVKFTFFRQFDLVSADPIPAGRWVQVVAVCPSRQPVRLYINGRQVRAGVAQLEGLLDPFENWQAGGPVAPTDQTLVLGRNPGVSDLEPFVGDLDELVIYDKPLSDDDIRALYELGVVGEANPEPAPGGAR